MYLTGMICTKWTYFNLSDEIWRYQVNHTSLQAKMYVFFINQLEWKRYIFTLLPLSQDYMRSYIRSASELRRVRSLSAADNAIFSLTSLLHLHFKQTLSLRTEWHLLFVISSNCTLSGKITSTKILQVSMHATIIFILMLEMPKDT